MSNIMFIFLLVLMVVMNGLLIIYGYKYKDEKIFLDKKHYKDILISIFSLLYLIAIIESIISIRYSNIPNFIIMYIYLHIAIATSVLIYYAVNYVREQKTINNFNKQHEPNKIGGKVKGREVEVKYKKK